MNPTNQPPKPKLSERAAYSLACIHAPAVCEVTGWEPWYARNILAWRAKFGLPITPTRAVQ